MDKDLRLEPYAGEGRWSGIKRTRVGCEAKFHQDSKYRGYRPDFAALARLYPDTFGHLVIYLNDDKSEALIDWKDPISTRALTKTLLRHDFGLEWDIPLERLCPPVPNRLNYVCWVKDLLSLGGSDTSQSRTGIRGLDVGTGASAIYPLLGCKLHDWSFLGTDIDPEALEAASANVRENHMEDRISLQLVSRVDYSELSSFSFTALQTGAGSVRGPIQTALDAAGMGSEYELDFVMCNPPFFASLDEIHSGFSLKSGRKTSKRISTDPHGCADEMITPGGELAFVTAMILDSLALRDRVRWYSSMVGKKLSLKKLLGLLREAGVQNVRTTQFAQGRTTRWGIAWSFSQAGLAEVKGAGASAHKVFGKRKMVKKRETSFSFSVRFNPPLQTADVEEGSSEEAVVLDRVLEYFSITRNLCVLRVGITCGAAEDLFRKMIVVELSSHGTPTKAPPVVVSAFAAPPVPPSDPGWKMRCVVLITVLAGAGHEDSNDEALTTADLGREPQPLVSEEMNVDDIENGERGREGECSVEVNIEMTSGGDRPAFWKLCNLLPGEVSRTNRKWRRKTIFQEKKNEAASNPQIGDAKKLGRN